MRIPECVWLLLALSASTPSLYSQATLSVQVDHPEKPVAGMPFVADLRVVTVQHVGTGPGLTRQATGAAYRSSDGLERFDATMVSSRKQDDAPETLTWILNPLEHTAILLNSRLRTATVTHLPANATARVGFLPLPSALPSGDDLGQLKPAKTELGHDTQDGMELTGTRVTTTIAAHRIGNDEALNIVTETWMAPSLKLMVRQSVANPLVGDRGFLLTNVRRQEPDSAIFTIPPGYTVEERPELALGSAAVAQAPRTPGIQKALDGSDPNRKNETARSLVNSPDHVLDAEILARQAVDTEERKLDRVGAHGSKDKDFDQMIRLSEYWDTLGTVLYRERKLSEAEAYTRAAWQLEPHGFLAVHLGRIYEDESRPADAIAIYRMALGEHPTQMEKDQIEARLTGLGAASAEPMRMEVSVPLKTLRPEQAPAATDAVYDMVLSHSAPAEVRLAQGRGEPDAAVVEAIRSAMEGFVPDAGPERLTRRARLVCTTDLCALYFVPSDVARHGVKATPTLAQLEEMAVR